MSQFLDMTTDANVPNAFLMQYNAWLTRNLNQAISFLHHDFRSDSEFLAGMKALSETGSGIKMDADACREARVFYFVTRLCTDYDGDRQELIKFLLNGLCKSRVKEAVASCPYKSGRGASGAKCPFAGDLVKKRPLTISNLKWPDWVHLSILGDESVPETVDGKVPIFIVSSADRPLTNYDFPKDSIVFLDSQGPHDLGCPVRQLFIKGSAGGTREGMCIAADKWIDAIHVYSNVLFTVGEEGIDSEALQYMHQFAITGHLQENRPDCSQD